MTSRICTVVFASGAPNVTVDMIDPTATFPCQDTDTGTITAVDSNIVGPSPVSDPPFPWNAAEVTVNPPPAPTVLGVTFADAAVAAAAKATARAARKKA